MYSTLEQATPMIKALSIVKGYDINPETVNLETLGNDFREALLNLSYEEKLKKGIHYKISATPEESIGKWAFFTDISLFNGIEYAFGIVLGARNTKQWTGTRFFVQRPHLSSMSDFANTCPVIFDIDIDGYPLFEGDNQDICSNYLNCYCDVEYNGKMVVGYISSFSDSEKTIEVSLDDNKHTIINYDDRNTKILNLREVPQSIAFSMTVTHN